MHPYRCCLWAWMTLVTCLGVALTSDPLFAQTRLETQQEKVTAKVDERIELTAIVARLAGYGEYDNNDFKLYADDVDRYFAGFKHHPAVEFAKQVREKNKIGYDAVPSLAVHLNPPPLLTPRVEFATAVLDSRWGKADAEKFADLLRQFYQDAECAKFFRAHQAMYRTVEQRYQATLNKVNFAWYKQFYGEQPDGTLNLFIGLLNGGGNYGVRVILPDGREDHYAVMMTYRMDKQGLPIYGEGDLPYIIHEYNHSFVNKLIEKNAPQFEKFGTALEHDTATADMMRRQAYTGFKTVVIESVVRAGVVRYLRRNPTGSMTAQTQLGEEEGRGFLWTGKLVALLDEYEKNRSKYPTLGSFIPRIVHFFDTVPAQLADLKKSFAFKQPKVVKITPFPNGASHVDETVEEVYIHFDKKMLPRTGLYTIDAIDPFVSPPVFSKDGKALVGKVKLKPQQEYGLGLMSFVFRSAAGYPLAEDFRLYFTTRGYSPPAPDPNFGYIMQNGMVTFRFVKPEYLKAEVQNVSVAGEFNGWKPKSEGFELQKTAENVYQLSLKADKLGKPGEVRQFKFVVNGTIWVAPPRYALNIHRDMPGNANGNANLVIKLE